MRRPGSTLIQTKLIHDIEDVRQPVKGAELTVSQIQGGRLTGSVTHGILDGISVTVGRFSKAVRSQGIMSRDRHVIGMLLGRDDAVSYWSFDMRPGDVVFDGVGTAHDAIYKGGARFAGIALSSAELTGLMAGEAAMADLDFWQRRTQIRPEAALGAAVSSRFSAVVRRLDEHAAGLSPAGSAFWMRALVEAFVSSASGGVPWDGNSSPVRSALIVRKVDDFLWEHGNAPVHISELCQALDVSRRTLHRAFDETLGIGPVTYLRRQRLNQVRRALLDGGSATRSVTELALNFGFDDVGRFAGYYRQLFGELPSATMRRRKASR
jgi:AraC family ethanolamine operon transcriptional activator